MHILNIIINFAYAKKEDWQSDRMRWTRNPVYHFLGIGGLNPSSSALQNMLDDENGVHFGTPFSYIHATRQKLRRSIINEKRLQPQKVAVV